MHLTSEIKLKDSTLALNTGRTQFHEQFQANDNVAKIKYFALKIFCMFIGLASKFNLSKIEV